MSCEEEDWKRGGEEEMKTGRQEGRKNMKRERKKGTIFFLEFSFLHGVKEADKKEGRKKNKK